MAAAVAEALGVRGTGAAPLVNRLVEMLGDKRQLILLDNFEQVVDAAPLVAHLLARCPALTALVTSRTRLRLSEEREFPVLPLTLPDRGDVPPSLLVAESAAVRLFVARAEAVKPGFILSDENAIAVAAICHRLDGLPLPIEHAIADALALASEVAALPSQPAVAPPPSRSGLTPCEEDVLRLLADGRSNREIAATLSLSERTVEHHVLHILAKLDLPSRAAAAAYAVRHGLA